MYATHNNYIIPIFSNYLINLFSSTTSAFSRLFSADHHHLVEDNFKLGQFWICGVLSSGIAPSPALLLVQKERLLVRPSCSTSPQDGNGICHFLDDLSTMTRRFGFFLPGAIGFPTIPLNISFKPTNTVFQKWFF